MRRRHITALVVGLACLAGVLFGGCAHQITAYPEQPQITTKGENHAEVLVFFTDVANVDDLEVMCVGATERIPYACAFYYPPRDPAHPDRALVIIVAIAPTDFNDVPKLALWGHELAHGRGWRH